MGREPGRRWKPPATRSPRPTSSSPIFCSSKSTSPQAILPDLQARRDACDAMVGVIADPQVVHLTRMGELDMSKPASGAMKLLKKLRGERAKRSNSARRR
jgi:hypothetical protein